MKKNFRIGCLIATTVFAGLNAFAQDSDEPVVGHGNSIHEKGAAFIGFTWQAGYKAPDVGNYGLTFDMYTSSGLGFRFDWLMNYGVTEGTGGFKFTLGPEYGYEINRNILVGFSIRGGLSDYKIEYQDNTAQTYATTSSSSKTFTEKYLEKYGNQASKKTKDITSGLIMFGPSAPVMFSHIYVTVTFDFGWAMTNSETGFNKMWSITGGYKF